MADRGPWLLLCLSCITCVCSGSAARHTVKGFTPLWFLTEPSDMLAVQGESVRLNCSVYSSAPYRVQWRKDGTFLNLESQGQWQLLQDGSLLITNVTLSHHGRPDDGMYQCLATIADLGAIGSRYAQLVVTGPPRLSGQVGPVSVQQGQSEVMACGVDPELAALVHWEHQGERVQLSRRLVQLDSAALLVSNASVADAGHYRCTVNINGLSKTSDEVLLQVLPETVGKRKLEFLRQPVAMTKVEGGSVLLPCVLVGVPLPQVRWMLGNQPIEESEGRVEVVCGGSLRILNLTTEDAGIYRCVAHQGNLTVEAQAELNVQVPPRFLQRPASVYAHEASDVLFQCRVTGAPAPRIQWLKDGETVIPSDYFRILREGDLLVQGLVQSDEGYYQCLAHNQAGNVQSSAQLIVLNHTGVLREGGPAPSAPRDVVAALVSTRFIKLTWRPPAEPHAELGHVSYSVFYSQDGSSRERVMNSSQVGALELTVQNLQPGTKYVFRVAAWNLAGLGERSAPLTTSTQAEVQVPGPASNLLASAISPTSISLSWEKPLSGSGDILTYRLYYLEQGLGNEQDLGVSGLSYTLTGLKKFTNYSLRMVAHNKHGPGVSTQDIHVRTLSDVPSAPPQNLTLEVQNSQSIMVHWLPPPTGTLNGELIGYRVRYRRSMRKSEVSEIATGTQLMQLVDGLERGTEYTFRVSAATVNGTGPATDWVAVETFESDLDESQVPDAPGSLHLRPLVSSIVVSWTPPERQAVLVRGYIIGYGIGSPHAQTIRVDYKQRYFTIEDLDPSSQYVITLKAYNNMGEGIPVYESAITRPQSEALDPEVDLHEVLHAPPTLAADPASMLPPVGVQALVLSHDAIRVSWADNSLPKNQRVTDTRHYTLRWKTNVSSSTKLKTVNTTSLSYTVTGLKPNTLYEFSVMVTRGRRSSTWSMTAYGTTLESAPSTSPKDVTVVSKEGRPRTIIINWQPPSEANGKITGYIIYYSTEVGMALQDWVVEPVMGNRLTHQIQDVTLDTPYYIRLQARNVKGLGPASEPVLFRTPRAEPSDKMANDQGNHASGTPAKPGSRGRPPAPDSGFGSTVGKSSVLGVDADWGIGSDAGLWLIVAVVSVGLVTIMVVVGVAILCTRNSSSRKRAVCKTPKSSSQESNPNPPDLWIHHEQLDPEPQTLQDGNGQNPSPKQGFQHAQESEGVTSAPAGPREPKPKLTDSHYSVEQSSSTGAPSSSALTTRTAKLQEPDRHAPSHTPKEDPSLAPSVHAHPAHPLRSFTTPTAAPYSPGFSCPTPPSHALLTQTGHEGSAQLQEGSAQRMASIDTLAQARAPRLVSVPSAPNAPQTTIRQPDELSEEMAHLEA
ncbi:hypothetical protein AGOR_G00162570 [Albula goreensis]|uniref:Uncharacterized protein n=1 Tax=Albula goreensis TaxID=1534307 RepID=A0A8T3D458_9TELE|nr:hypothetical protein AGOR_G00162570 [Albula goreensis]